MVKRKEVPTDVDEGIIALEPEPLTNFGYKTELEITLRNLDTIQQHIHAALQKSKEHLSGTFVTPKQLHAIEPIADLLEQTAKDMAALLSFREHQSRLIAESEKEAAAVQ